MTAKRVQLNFRLSDAVRTLFERLCVEMSGVQGEPLSGAETLRRLIVAEAQRRKMLPKKNSKKGTT